MDNEIHWLGQWISLYSEARTCWARASFLYPLETAQGFRAAIFLSGGVMNRVNLCPLDVYFTVKFDLRKNSPL